MSNEPVNDPIKQALDGLKNNLHVSTQVQLNEARHAALTQAKQPARQRWLMPAAGLASVAAVAFTWVLLNNDASPLSEHDPSIFTDLEILAQEADTDFYQDLDFLTWLDENDLMESEI